MRCTWQDHDRSPYCGKPVRGAWARWDLDGGTRQKKPRCQKHRMNETEEGWSWVLV